MAHIMSQAQPPLRPTQVTSLDHHRLGVVASPLTAPLVVVFDLGPHVKVLRVLDRQLMQAEGVTDLGQLLFGRLEQSQPDKTALPGPGRRLGQRHRAFVAPAAILVVSKVNDHVREPPRRAAPVLLRAAGQPARDRDAGGGGVTPSAVSKRICCSGRGRSPCQTRAAVAVSGWPAMATRAMSPGPAGRGSRITPGGGPAVAAGPGRAAAGPAAGAGGAGTHRSPCRTGGAGGG